MSASTPLKRDPSKALQIGFLVLLLISIAQVAYWIGDYVAHARDVERRFAELYDAEAAALTVADGDTTAAARQYLPHLDFDGAGDVDVRPDALEALADERSRQINRILWEGGFFLVVLLGGLAVLTRTIRHDAELRRRQQNFLAAVSHEFKSPLASMRLAAETLVMRSREADTQRLGQRMLEDGERLLRMVDNLLDTTRLEEGRQRLAPEPTSLAPAIRASIAEIAERAAGHGIEIAADVDESLELSIDPVALDTVLRNLLDNAVKACAASGGRRISVGSRRVGGRIELTVSDDGLGFPPEDAALMFEKFYRLGDELRRQTPGTGLGLYIVKRLVELSGGRIEATSAGPGCGATLTIAWPERLSR
jgi:signal transduction histidine kinase